MSRRLIIGNDGSGFRIRASKPGWDALTAPLEGLLFDADHYPGRIAASGVYRTAGSNGASATSPSVYSFSHGLGHAPDLVVALATPVGNPYAGTTSEGAGVALIGRWLYVYRIGNTGSYSNATLNPEMDHRWCSPFRFDGVLEGGGPQNIPGGTEFGGWWYEHNATDIIVHRLLGNQIDVRWSALEVF